MLQPPHTWEIDGMFDQARVRIFDGTFCGVGLQGVGLKAALRKLEIGFHFRRGDGETCGKNHFIAKKMVSQELHGIVEMVTK